MMQNNNDEDFLVDASGHRHQPHSGPARIVSLVPSLTELVCDLGLAGQLVGRTGFCIHPRAILKPIPKVGGTKDVNLERLRELAPTHVIVNVDENRRECVEEIGVAARVRRGERRREGGEAPRSSAGADAGPRAVRPGSGPDVRRPRAQSRARARCPRN